MTRSTRLVLYWYTSKMIKSLPLPEEALFFPSLQDISRQEDCHSKAFAAFFLPIQLYKQQNLIKVWKLSLPETDWEEGWSITPFLYEKKPSSSLLCASAEKSSPHQQHHSRNARSAATGEIPQPRPDRLS